MSILHTCKKNCIANHVNHREVHVFFSSPIPFSLSFIPVAAGRGRALRQRGGYTSVQPLCKDEERCMSGNDTSHWASELDVQMMMMIVVVHVLFSTKCCSMHEWHVYVYFCHRWANWVATESFCMDACASRVTCRIEKSSLLMAMDWLFISKTGIYFNLTGKCSSLKSIVF